MFKEFICAITKLPCCGCSLFCSNREKKKEDFK